MVDCSREDVALDALFLFFNGILVFLMQLGFCMLEAGFVETVTVAKVIVKNVGDFLVSNIVFYLVGYALAFGKGGVIFGWSGFALQGVSDCELGFFFFQMSFAATAITIISGSMAGRTTQLCYITYSCMMAALIYPSVVHWGWSAEGWLLQRGFLDFAGSGIVHLCGGTAAFVGASLIGPRVGRLKNGVLIDLMPNSVPFVVIGGMFLIFCFLSFNVGSLLSVAETVDTVGQSTMIIGLVAVNTLMAICGGSISATLLKKFFTGYASSPDVINGALGGAVAICAGANVMEPWSSFATGFIGGTVVHVVSILVERLGVDDAVDAAAVHAGCGLWGLVAAPLFARGVGVIDSPGQASLEVLGWNLVGAVAIMAWTGSICGIMFQTLSYFDVLRLSADDETEFELSKADQAVSKMRAEEVIIEKNQR